MDEKAILERFQNCKNSVGCKLYQRQKSALEQQLSTFLSSVSPPKTISSRSADDVIKFPFANRICVSGYLDNLLPFCV